MDVKNKDRFRLVTTPEHVGDPTYNTTQLVFSSTNNRLKTASGEVVTYTEIHDLINKSGCDLDGDIIYIRDELFVCDYRILIKPTSKSEHMFKVTKLDMIFFGSIICMAGFLIGAACERFIIN